MADCPDHSASTSVTVFRQRTTQHATARQSTARHSRARQHRTAAGHSTVRPLSRLRNRSDSVSGNTPTPTTVSNHKHAPSTSSSVEHSLTWPALTPRLGLSPAIGTGTEALSARRTAAGPAHEDVMKKSTETYHMFLIVIWYS